MLAKITSKNQITIPKKIIDQMPEAQYFDVEIKEGNIVEHLALSLKPEEE